MKLPVLAVFLSYFIYAIVTAGGDHSLLNSTSALVPQTYFTFNDITVHADLAQENNLHFTSMERMLPCYQRSYLTNHQSTPEFFSTETLRYQYQLEGHDKEWVDASKWNFSTYSELPPGDYILKVKVFNNTLEELALTSLAFSIEKPFWLRWWFMLIVFGVMLILLYDFYRYRINQLLRVQRIKNCISADLHDDIGSRLTNIQFLSALSKRKLQEGMEADQLLKEIEEEVQASAEALDEIVWNIKINDESLDDIVAKMRRYASEALENDDIGYRVDVEAIFSNKKMSMQKRRELFLMFKEMLNNIRKHAQARQVAIKVSITNEMFCLLIQDDGRGFDPQQATDRNGLRNIRERVKKWRGIFQIQSQIEIGTCITLCIPFDNEAFFRTSSMPVLRFSLPKLFLSYHPKR